MFFFPFCQVGTQQATVLGKDLTGLKPRAQRKLTNRTATQLKVRVSQRKRFLKNKNWHACYAYKPALG
jgi:hypothetical protein